MLDLKELMKSETKFKKIWESPCKNHRVLYFQINNDDNGIEAHFHPYGEDHALILEGELTYDVSFKEQIVAKKSDIVFGWTNYVHGYHNFNDKPLHILVFATPENNLSLYNQSELPTQDNEKIRKIEKLTKAENLASNRVIFSSVPPNDFSKTLIIDLVSQKIEYTQHGMGNYDSNLYVTFKLPIQ
ncbi:cupin domain-containing protein [Solibacillus sp. MA9]|uniref:Cupin domain-containing protein n=1 Tax=Solibacillus palustris TaxID=2908203 RepID=A0ABS9UDQ5_9BACL|nr:cupin domain-containing protein [Solibacillus sp. MA9]MCH7322103.1 cupin domain-containing protein [Solibacillus sp. MA9]